MLTCTLCAYQQGDKLFSITKYLCLYFSGLTVPDYELANAITQNRETCFPFRAVRPDCSVCSLPPRTAVPHGVSHLAVALVVVLGGVVGGGEAV